MTQTYTNLAGEEIDINIAGNIFLTKITCFLWDKIGFHPTTKADCELVVRILKNYIKLSEYFQLNPNDFWGINQFLNIPYDSTTIKWLEEEIIPFFERSEGLIYEED